MRNRINTKARRFFAAVLALTFIWSVLPYNALSGVLGFMATTAYADEGKVAEIEVVNWNTLLGNTEAAEVTTQNKVTTVKLKSCIKTPNGFFLSVNYNSGAINNYVLDLNGYGIRYSGPDKDLSVIRVDGVTFTLEDNCTSPGTYYLINSFYYKNNAFRTGSVTKTAPTGTENVDYAVVTGGYITGGYTHIISGSGINVSGGKFEMRGGTVIGNASSVISNLGLGLSIGYGCKVYMHGGSIRLNGVHKIPGSNVNNDGDFYVRDGLTVGNVYHDKINYYGDYAVTTSVTAGQGSISAEPTTFTVDGETFKVSGKPVRLNVTPEAGYRVLGIEAVYVDPQGNTQYAPVTCKATDAEYEFTMPAGDAAVSVEFEKYYTVTWNVDGVETQTYPADGAVPHYDGTVEKTADAEFTYTFAGWSDGANTYEVNEVLPAAVSDVTYTALFSQTVNNYTVTWKDGDDVLDTAEVPYGTAPAFGGEMPGRTDTAQYSYVFYGWNDGETTYAAGNLPPVTGDVTYTADFTQSIRKYTVTLPENAEITNNVALSDGKADYGTEIKFKPTYSMAVSGDVTVNGAAVLTPDENGEYTVTVTGDTVVQAEIKRDVDFYTEIIFEGCNFETDELTYPYEEGTTYAPSVTVGDYSDGYGDGYKTLVPGTDYTVTYANNTGSPTEVVTATATITGIGDYGGTAIKTFRISPFSISDSACTVNVPDQTLDGYSYIYYKFENANYHPEFAAQIDAVVTYGDKVLTYGTDYTFGNVVYAGEHDEWDTMPYRIGDQCQVEIIGAGDYIGMKLSNVFTIVSPAGSGTLDNITWDLTNGKLTITGSGAMPELDGFTQYPWFRYASSITEIEIGEGITSIAKEAFSGSSNMSYYSGVQTVTLASSVKTIGGGAFAFMTSLETIDLSSVTSIGVMAFDQCGSLDITVPQTVTALAENAFSGCVNVKFTIIWKNHDGEVLGTSIEPYSYDDTPVYGGETPVKPKDVQYTYTFSGWSPELEMTHTNVIYTAQFNAAVNKYDVTFKDQDGATIDIISFDYGTTPVYPTRVFEKLNDQYSLVIHGWTDGANTYAFDALPSVTGEASYNAVIVEEENSYTVTWKNWDGAVLETDENVLYNSTPEYNGETPTKVLLWEGTTDYYHFTFTGWDKTVAPVSGDVTYTAQFSYNDVDSYMDGDTLVLKGDLAVANPNDNYYSMLMPLNADQTAPVDKDDVIHIRVDASGANFPADSAQMFLGFHNVTDIDLTGADTSGVTDMNSMFWYCSSLTDLDISGFDTSSVTDMSEMFVRCFEITELDLSSFDTGKVTNMARMFSNCPKLETIYVSNKWTTEKIENQSIRVFSDCRSLSGERGSFCTSDYSDANYARIDGTSNSRGYLTSKYYVKIANDVCEADRDFVTGKDGSRLVYVYPKDGFEITGLTVMYGETQVPTTNNANGIFSFSMPREDVVVTADFEFVYDCGAFMGAAADSSKTRADLYFTIPDAADPADFTVTVDGGEPVCLADMTPDANGYKFSITVPAKNMGDKIDYSLNYNGTEIKSGEVSVADYAANLAQYYPQYADFAAAMLAYGAAAQNYFGYDTDNLVSDADLASLAPVSGEAFDKAEIRTAMIANAAIPVHYSAMNVTFLSDTTFSLAFRIKSGFTNDEAVEWVEANITLDGAAVSASVKESGEYRFVVISKQNIALDRITEDMALVVNGVGTYSVSVLNYLAAAEQTNNANLKYLTRALYAYSYEAIAIKG